MGRNSISLESIEHAVQLTAFDMWHKGLATAGDLSRSDENSEWISYCVFPEKTFLQRTWNVLVHHLENPYPVGNRASIVPIFGFTKRSYPVECSYSDSGAETMKLNNGSYYVWVDPSRGFMVSFAGENNKLGKFNQKTEGIPVLSLGDADDFADYLMDFDKWIPTIEERRHSMVFKMETLVKASQVVKVTLQSMAANLHIDGLSINTLYLLDDNTVFYKLEYLGLKVSGECALLQMKEMLLSFLRQAEDEAEQLPF